MIKSIKFAVSIPSDEFKELEILRKKQGLTRSAFISKAIRLWKESKKKEKLIRLYVEGYKRIPENVREIKALEQASSEVMVSDDWL